MLTCGLFKRNTHDGCIKLLSKQADNLYTPEQYENTILFILGQCVVQTQGIEQTIILTRAIREEHKNDLKMSRMPAIKGRPRLRLVSILFICLNDMNIIIFFITRDKLSTTLKTEDRKAHIDTMLDTWESYTGFCYKHQFPPTLSDKVKSRLYFLASQTRWDWAKHLHKIISSSTPILDKVAAHPITQPDLPVIIRVIENLSMNGSAPFAQVFNNF